MKVSFKLGLIWKIHVVTAVTLACTVGISSPCARPDATVCVLLGRGEWDAVARVEEPCTILHGTTCMRV